MRLTTNKTQDETVDWRRLEKSNHSSALVALHWSSVIPACLMPTDLVSFCYRGGYTRPTYKHDVSMCYTAPQY